MAMLDRQARNAASIGMDQDPYLVATSQQCAHEVGAYMPCRPSDRYLHCGGAKERAVSALTKPGSNPGQPAARIGDDSLLQSYQSGAQTLRVRADVAIADADFLPITEQSAHTGQHGCRTRKGSLAGLHPLEHFLDREHAFFDLVTKVRRHAQ